MSERKQVERIKRLFVKPLLVERECVRCAYQFPGGLHDPCPKCEPKPSPQAEPSESAGEDYICPWCMSDQRNVWLDVCGQKCNSTWHRQPHEFRWRWDSNLCSYCGEDHRPAASQPSTLPQSSPQGQGEIDPATKLLADVMHLWVDGYISKAPNSMAPDSVSKAVFDTIEEFLATKKILVDYCGWQIDYSITAAQSHPVVEIPQLVSDEELNRHVNYLKKNNREDVWDYKVAIELQQRREADRQRFGKKEQ